MDVSIRDFVTAVGGQLEMSSLPPIGGVHDTISRIRFDSRECGKGSLFWPLAPTANSLAIPQAGCSDEAFADHAFSNGALGVVVSRRAMEPWAGGFAVRVDDGRAALARFARWNRRRFLAPVALVLDFDGSVGETLQAVWGHECGLGSGSCYRTTVQNQMCLAQLEEDRAYHIVVVPPEVIFSCQETISEISDLCHPDIVVITPLAFETHRNAHQFPYHNCPRRSLESLFRIVKDAPVAIVPSDTSTMTPRSEFSGEVVSYGFDDRCQIQAERIKREGSFVKFDVQGSEYQVLHTCDNSLSHALAAIALCDLLKINKNRIQSALMHEQETRTAF